MIGYFMRNCDSLWVSPYFLNVTTKPEARGKSWQLQLVPFHFRITEFTQENVKVLNFEYGVYNFISRAKLVEIKLQTDITRNSVSVMYVI